MLVEDAIDCAATDAYPLLCQQIHDFIPTTISVLSSQAQHSLLYIAMRPAHTSPFLSVPVVPDKPFDPSLPYPPHPAVHCRPMHPHPLRYVFRRLPCLLQLSRYINPCYTLHCDSCDWLVFKQTQLYHRVAFLLRILRPTHTCQA